MVGCPGLRSIPRTCASGKSSAAQRLALIAEQGQNQLTKLDRPYPSTSAYIEHPQRLYGRKVQFLPKRQAK